MAEKFYLIDGHSHLYRAFFAVKGLTGPDGRPTNAVYGFAAMLRRLLREQAPDYLAVAFDLPAPTFRHKMYTEYKATRQKPPDEFIAQIPMLRELLDALRIPVYAVPGFEADDVMGTVAKRLSAQGLDVVLVTGDKDAAQLLAPHVTLLDTLKEQVTTAETLRERDAIAPAQVIEMLALAGDSSDNIPGVPKVGPKTALELVHQFGTLDNLLARLDEVKSPALRDRLRANAELARLSHRLVVIDTNVPMEIDLAAARVAPPEPERVVPIYQKFGFRQFLAEMSATQAPTKEEAEYHLVDTEEKFKKFLGLLRAQKRFALDTETTSATPMAAKLCGLSFSWKPREAWYVPVRGPMGDKVLDKKTVLDALRPILTDPAVGKVGQNIKYDAIVLRNHGVEVAGITFDTMVAAYILDADRRRYGLDDLAADFLDYHMIPITDLIGKGRTATTMDCVPVEKVCEYSCADADITLRLTDLFEPRLREKGLLDLFDRYELPLIPVLADMEYQGIKLDVAVLGKISAWLAGEMARIEKDIYKEAGEEFNIASTKQLSRILFEKLKLQSGRRTKTGVSTDSDVLEQLSLAHRLPGLVLEYRQMAKIKSTYADSLPEMVIPATGRVHTSFNQTATTTGRLSSSDPNLQNIPIRTEVGERIRQAFVPSGPDRLLLTADYSQIELRILAHICRDAALVDAFAKDLDIHQFVAAQVHNVKPEQVTPVMRRAAKAVNFGIIYGLTPFGLSKELGISPKEAETFITGYFEKYPGVKKFIDDTIAEAHKQGSVATLCGRRRPLPGLEDANRAVRSFAERAAVNAVIQGTAADMIKMAMIRIYRRLRAERMESKMLLQIHDELVFDLPESEQAALTNLVRAEMIGALALSVPIKVNVAVGKNWQEAK